MSTVKLYNFIAGWLNTVDGRRIPVPFYLIQHGDDNILFDTGINPGCRDDPLNYMGAAIAESTTVEMKDDEFAVNAIEKVGLKAEDINYVIYSHLHFDHTGANGYFPNAKYIVQEADLEAAYDLANPYKIMYLQQDIDKPIEWIKLKGYEQDDYDLFGDGSIRMWFTPGHSAGHMSLVVRTEQDGCIVLTADACNDDEILRGEAGFIFPWNLEEAEKSLDRLRNAQDVLKYTLITPHDCDNWDKFKLAPDEYYI